MRVGQSRKRDANEAPIRQALAQIGVQTWPVSAPGAPDLIFFARHEHWGVLEIKMPGEALTPLQQALYKTAPFPIAHSVQEALALFGVRS